jgi:putative peptidoglycan lipid II flippase
MIGLTLGSLLTGLTCWGVLQGLQHIWGTEGFFLQLLQLSLAGLAGLGVFAGVLTQLRLAEVEQIVGRIRQKLQRPG